MFTEREVMDLGDRIMGHLSLINKFDNFSHQCSDQQVMQVINKHRQMLQNDYQTMMGLLQEAGRSPAGVSYSQYQTQSPSQQQITTKEY